MNEPDDLEVTAQKLEAEIQRKVSHSISKIEVALAEWDAAKKKPEAIAEKIDHLRFLYKLLCIWEQDSLGGEKELPSVMERLKKYVEICKKIDEYNMVL